MPESATRELTFAQAVREALAEEMRRDSRVCIIGAGISGLCAAIQLQRQLGHKNFVLFEKAHDIGGAWLANKYPGMLADDLADYMYARSTGHFASLMTLIARGCLRAVASGEERLTAGLLDKVNNDAASEKAH